VLYAVLALPGSHTLKDRRQVVRSLRDRIRARHEVTCHEIPGENPGRQSLVVTTAGSSALQVRGALDAVARLLYETRDAMLVTLDIDVQRWQPPELRLPASSSDNADG
jgi:uncharacterized protein YlxP (DUF503 family)